MSNNPELEGRTISTVENWEGPHIRLGAHFGGAVWEERESWMCTHTNTVLISSGL